MKPEELRQLCSILFMKNWWTAEKELKEKNGWLRLGSKRWKELLLLLFPIGYLSFKIMYMCYFSTSNWTNTWMNNRKNCLFKWAILLHICDHMPQEATGRRKGLFWLIVSNVSVPSGGTSGTEQDSSLPGGQETDKRRQSRKSPTTASSKSSYHLPPSDNAIPLNYQGNSQPVRTEHLHRHTQKCTSLISC